MPKVSFIIPAYNEASRIGATLRGVLAYFGAQKYDWEVIVVDDGSADGTARVVEELQAEAGGGLRLVRLGQNQGKGAAVRRGMLEAEGEVRIFSDADGSTPVEETAPLLAEIAEGADIVIGSRALP